MRSAPTDKSFLVLFFKKNFFLFAWLKPMLEPFSFDAESDGLIAKVLAKYPEHRKASGVLPLLDIAQRQMGRVTGSAWVPRVAMDEIARRLSMPQFGSTKSRRFI